MGVLYCLISNLNSKKEHYFGLIRFVRAVAKLWHGGQLWPSVHFSAARDVTKINQTDI